MKTQLMTYLNTDTMTPEYGVKVFYKGKWMPLAIDGKAFVVKTAAEAESKRKELRQVTIA